MSHGNRLQPGAEGNRVRTASRTPNAAASLRKRRRWYADDDKQDNPPGADDKEGEKSTDSEDGDDKQPGADNESIENLPELAQKLIEKARKDAAKYRAQLRKKEDAEAEAERKRKESQGEFEKLYREREAEIERLKGFEAQVQALAQAQAERNKARITALPKAQKTHISAIVEKLGGEKADPYAVSDVLDELEPLLTAGSAPDLDGGNRGDGKNDKEYVGSEKHLKEVKNRYRLNK